MSSFLIRSLEARDIASIGHLLRESFAPRLHPYMVYTQTGIAEFLRLRLRYPESFPGSHALVAHGPNGTPVGFCDFRLTDSVAFLSYICVASSARGQGLATTLIAEYLAGPGRGARRVELDVFDDSQAAISLYDRLGFIPTGRQLWTTRPLPPPSSPVPVPGIKDVVASLDRYGFCDFTVVLTGSEHKFGMLGGSVLRCFHEQDLGDEAVLAALRATFPNLAEALVITPEPAQSSPGVDATVINRSSRMTASLPLTTTHREVVLP